MRSMVLFLLCASTSLIAAEDCPNATTTCDIGICLAEQLEQQEVELQHYLAESKARYIDDTMVIGAIDKAQQSWLTYRKDQCHSIYTIWRGGTIRSVMGLTCSISMTKKRTHQIWQNYLTYGDNTPALLPEPEI